MAYSEFLADRLKQHLQGKAPYECKKMMGGLVFMVNGKMCFGVNKEKNTNTDRLMVRVGKEMYEELLQLKGCREMNFTGKVMQGFLYVDPEGFDTDHQLSFWLDKALAFNVELNGLQ